MHACFGIDVCLYINIYTTDKSNSNLECYIYKKYVQIIFKFKISQYIKAERVLPNKITNNMTLINK